MTTVYQLLANATMHDAVTDQALAIQNNFSALKIDSKIIVPKEHIHNSLAKKVYPLHQFGNLKSTDFLLYHYSIGSLATKYYEQMNSQKIICYHNITPEKYFLPYSDSLASLLREGRRDLKRLSYKTDYALADSEFNKKELKNMGFKNICVLPLVLKSEYLGAGYDQALFNKLNKVKMKFISVGRIVPNKRIENIIKTFSIYFHTVSKQAKLYLIGATDTLPGYFSYLQNLIGSLGINGSVIFTGKVTVSELVAYYKSANAYLCLSEHEGFCLPLIESMYFEVPIFALNSSAIQETLGGTGVLLNDLDCKRLVELMGFILEDQDRIKQIRKMQKERVKFFLPDNYQTRFSNAISFILNNKLLEQQINE